MKHLHPLSEIRVAFYSSDDSYRVIMADLLTHGGASVISTSDVSALQASIASDDVDILCMDVPLQTFLKTQECPANASMGLFLLNLLGPACSRFFPRKTIFFVSDRALFERLEREGCAVVLGPTRQDPFFAKVRQVYYGEQ